MSKTKTGQDKKARSMQNELLIYENKIQDHLKKKPLYDLIYK